MTDRAGRADLRTQTAIHAFANIDIEVSKLALLGVLVHVDANRNASDRTDTLTGQTAGGNIESEWEESAISEREWLLDRDRDLSRILDSHRAAHQMREGN